MSGCRKNGANTASEAGATERGHRADGRFAPGNPGKPRGARHRATRAAEALLEGEAEALTRKAVDRALEGDPVALRLCMERILPVRRERAVALDLPPLRSATDAVAAMAHILEAVARGILTPGEGARLGALVEGFRRIHELEELERRLERLEKAHEAKAGQAP